jgi:hypothetical protein
VGVRRRITNKPVIEDDAVVNRVVDDWDASGAEHFLGTSDTWE